MTHFTIWTVTPENYHHSRCFKEVSLGLASSLRDLGHQAYETTSAGHYPGIVIILGSHLLPHITQAWSAEHKIAYNLEPIHSDLEAVKHGYLSFLKSVEVWDYSRNNVDIMGMFGIYASHLPIGYSPGLLSIPKSEEKPIDVLLIGSFNERRINVIEKLNQRGVKIAYAYGLYGEERDFLYSRTKIALNIHYYSTRIFEIVRCSYLLANGIPIVSETGLDKAIESPFRGGIEFADYDLLADACCDLLAWDNKRKSLGIRGQEIFSSMPQTEYLKTVISKYIN